MDVHFSIAKDFSETPGARDTGAWSGKILVPVLKAQLALAVAQGGRLVIDLDGCEGLPASFLDGSFGPLGKAFGYEVLSYRLVFNSNEDPALIQEIWNLIKENDVSN